ncbi:MAG: hypothetical protein MSB08_06020 [Subdoligranulum sp.]|nr:hypothetical protein [Subdoligranulum sp.]
MAQSLCLTAFAEETTLEATPEAVTETEPVNEAVINEPEVEEPVVEEPVAEEPMAEEPMAEESVAEEPMAEEPMAEEPMAEEPEVQSEATQVLIPAGSDAATVNSILTKALLGKDANPDTTWEYECIGYYTQHITNKAWGPIAGFKSETRKLGIKTTYTHAALANNEDGIYYVRVTGTTNTFTIHKLAKLQSSIALKQDISLSMCYGQDGTPDIAATKEAIFAAVVESSTPELALSDVTMEYYATPSSDFLGSMVHEWAPLEGGKVKGIPYPAIGPGQQKIRISWGGNKEYGGFSAETTITLTERTAPQYTLKESPSIKLVYNDDLAVNYADIESAVFDAIVDTAPFTASDVSIEYYAEASTGSVGSMGKEWVPLKGGKVNVLTYPAISEGTWSIHIIYPGSQTLAPVTIEQDLEVCGREPMQFNLKEGPYTVGMVFNEQQGYDFAATAKAIYEAVVESTVPTLNFEDVKVEFNASPSDKIPSYRPLDYAFAGQNLFGEGTWSIRISWGGSKEYAPGDTVVSVTTTDNRIASQITLKSDASFTYNMDVTAMKQAVLDNVIDWNASTLPAKDTLSLEDFTFEYKASLSILDGVEGEIADKVLEQLKNNGALDAKVYVPFEGKNYDTLISGQTIAKYPQIGAGVQSIRVTYKGSAEYKPSQPTEGSITVNKAKVKVHVKSASMYVSEAANGLNLVTTTPDDHFNTFVVYAGVTRNVTTAVYLQLPESYTSNKVLIKLLDPILEKLGQPTFTEMLQNGITLGQLRQLLKTKEIVDVLEKIGIDTGALGQLIEVIDKLPAVGDNFRIAVGVPNRAGAYSVTAITDNKNYNVGVGVGALVLKADKAKLVWKQDIGKKISAANAKTADFAAELQMNGEAVSDQSSVHVLYSGLTSKWKAYSSTTTAPTEPGRYVMTVVVLGGNYQAAPITRSFQITK